MRESRQGEGTELGFSSGSPFRLVFVREACNQWGSLGSDKQK